jgi:hypothetical protein
MLHVMRPDQTNSTDLHNVALYDLQMRRVWRALNPPLQLQNLRTKDGLTALTCCQHEPDEQLL